MNEHTKFQLDQIDDGDLELLAIDLLTRQERYHGVDPQGGRGKDGGKDGLLLNGPDGTNTIVHVSRREDWKTKLKSDMEKAAKHDREYDIFVYVTNRVITGNQKPVPDVAQPFVDEYGWEVDIWDGDRLRVELDNHEQDLRERYLRIARDEDPADMAARLVEQRLSLIRRRADELPQPIEDGPVAVLHVIPHESVAGDTEFFVDELPTPRIPGNAGGYSTENTVDGRVTFTPGHPADQLQPQYTYIYVDANGWVEVVDAMLFMGDGMKIPSVNFERDLGDAYNSARSVLQELGLDAPVDVSLSLLSVKGYSFATGPGGGIGRTGPRVIRQQDVGGKPYTIDDLDTLPGQAMKRGFDRAWRAARWTDGSPNYSGGEWTFENPDAR